MENQSQLLPDERYMFSNWGLAGPNCVTFTFDNIHEALDNINKQDQYSDELKKEAQSIKDEIEKIHYKLRTPANIKKQLQQREEEKKKKKKKEED